MARVEGLVADWDFQGALRAVEKVHFDTPELKQRLAERRNQIGRMAELKDRVAALINQASSLAPRGFE